LPLVLNAAEFPAKVKFFLTEDNITPKLKRGCCSIGSYWKKKKKKKVPKGFRDRSPIEVARKKVEITSAMNVPRQYAC